MNKAIGRGWIKPTRLEEYNFYQGKKGQSNYEFSDV